MKKLKFCLLAALSFFPLKLQADASPSYPPNPYDTFGGKKAPEFSKANAAAIHWINLLDAHAFGGTWLEAGGLLRDLITSDQWKAAMEATRLTLGPAHARQVASHAFASHLPFGTRGNFIIITYDTQFQRMANAIETITLMTEGPVAEWRVIGYRITRGR